MSDWKQRILEKSVVATDLPEWRKKAISLSSIRANGPDEENIDKDADDAPAMVRMQVGSLDKPEDRLKALQQTYPDAKPYGDDNFIFTDPKSGKTRLYNNESWFPSLGDIASISPEIGETIGGGVGGILGSLGGSLLPGPGTVAGGILGAGTGSVAGREATQRGLNYLFGNDDTRTAGEQATDAAQTFAMGAAGEGLGRLAAKGLQVGKNAWNRRVIGEVDDPALAAERIADWEKIGVNPTAGMVSGNNKTSVLEHAIAATRSGDEINKRINDAFSAQAGEFDRIVGSMADRPLSRAEAGEALQRQAQAAKDAGFKRSEQLYDDVATKVTSPAITDNTATFLENLAKERAGYGEFDSLTKGATTDKVIQTTTALLSDAKNAMSFDQLKQARTLIGQQAADETDKVLKNQLNGLYASLTGDMEKTAAASGEDALQSFRKANNQFRRLVDDEKGFGRGSTGSTLISKNTDDILNWSLSGAKNGGNRIAQVRRTVQKSEGGSDAWNEVIAGVTDRLGRNSSEEFDPGQFLRNWNKMSEEAKSAMFAGTANAQYRKDLDTLSRIGENFTKYRKGANHSNTENHRAAKDSLNPLSRDNAVISFLGLATTADPITGMAIGAMKGGATAGASRLSSNARAKLLTSPETVRWLAELPKAEMKKGGISAHFATLSQLRKSTKDKALAAAINDYMRDNRYESED